MDEDAIVEGYLDAIFISGYSAYKSGAKCPKWKDTQYGYVFTMVWQRGYNAAKVNLPKTEPKRKFRHFLKKRKYI